jgi:hypothetical protein
MTKNIIALFVLITCTSTGMTQSLEQQVNREADEWTAKTGIYVPQSVRQSRLRESELDKLQRDKRSAQVAAVIVEKNEPDANKTVGSAFWLDTLPTIRVLVQPKPPQDFQLTINGESCPATEKAMYRVPAGAVTVKVWRQGTAVCEKMYTTRPGSTYDVQCTF